MKVILCTRTAHPNRPSTIDQERQCREYARRHGLTVVAMFHDTGAPQRSLEELIETATRMEADAVLVRDAARLGRQPAKSRQRRDMLQGAGLGVFVAESPTGAPQTPFELGLSLAITSETPSTFGRLRHDGRQRQAATRPA